VSKLLMPSIGFLEAFLALGMALAEDYDVV
jgi:hypothetical protein